MKKWSQIIIDYYDSKPLVGRKSKVFKHAAFDLTVIFYSRVGEQECVWGVLK